MTLSGLVDLVAADPTIAPSVDDARRGLLRALDLTAPEALRPVLGAALAATALSLIIAILVYAGYNLLVSRVESILLDMERSALALMNFMRQWQRNREAPKA